MAHIVSINIEGLLGRKKPIKLEFNKDTNIFFGENGSGKTALLKIIDAALNKDGAAMEAIPVEKAEINIFSITHDRTIKHVWERTQKVKKPASIADYDFWQASAASQDMREFGFPGMERNAWKIVPKMKDHTRWSHTFLPTTRLYLGEKSNSRQSKTEASLSEAKLDDLFAESVNRSWLLYYSRVLKEVSQIQEEGLSAVLRNVILPGPISPPNPEIDLESTYIRVNNFLKRQPQKNKMSIGSLAEFKNRYRDDDNLRRSVDNIDQVEKQIEKAMIPIDRFKITIEKLFSNGKKISSTLPNNQLQVELPDGTNISPANLSSGEKHLLKILLAAMTAGPNSVIIDEPELSMHIDWQREFVSTVLTLNPECQLIIASHSPEIMAEIEDDRIFKL